MIRALTPAEYETVLRQHFSTFAARCFYDLNPQTELATNWHLQVIAAKLTAVRQGKIRRLIINLPPPQAEPVLAADPSNPPRSAPAGGAGVPDHPPGVPVGHLHRRRADRARR